jgi:m7GpppX diphosphatase
MLHKIERGKKFTFVVNSTSDWTKEQGELVFENDVFKKYNTTLNNIEGQLIVCSDLSKLNGFCKKIARETYDEYCTFIAQRNFDKEQWVYNILDGTAEQENVLYRDECVVISRNYTWDGQDISQMYLLAFPTDKTLHSIRDLTGVAHAALLEHLRDKCLQVIKEIYGFESDVVKMFIHYAPTTYHLHVHFTLLSKTEAASSVEYSHELTNVITNIKLVPDYYQRITMNKRC